MYGRIESFNDIMLVWPKYLYDKVLKEYDATIQLKHVPETQTIFKRGSRTIRNTVTQVEILF